MADDADLTADRDEKEYTMRIAASRQPGGPPFTGGCHYCQEGLAYPLRYCDAECRDAHSLELRLKKQGGVE